MGRTWCAALASAASFAPIAFAQELRWTRVGEVNAIALGRSVSWVGDWDGDGRPEFAATSVINNIDSHYGPPRVLVVSSATGALLSSVTNGEPNSGFGERLFAIGDADGDGKTELAVFALDSIDPATGAIGSLSSWDSSGHERWTWRPAPAITMRRHPAAIGDVDGDAIRDLIVGYQGWTGTNADVDVVSGATGLLIRTHSGLALEFFGFVVGALGDCDQDGVLDYCVTTNSSGVGRVYAYSGATGAQLWTSSPMFPTFGVDPLDDVDGDSIDDAVLFGPGAGGVFGTGAVISGATGLFLRWINGADSSYDHVAVGDLDGDGVGDIVLASTTGTHLAQDLVAYSPATGLEIARRTIDRGPCTDLDGGVDFDGDGQVDLLCGFPEERNSGDWGEVDVIAPGGFNDLLRVNGGSFNSAGVGSGAALVPDRDGDGASEVAVAVVADVYDVPSYVQILSSIDGHELARVPVAGGIDSSSLPLIGVPDVDGDRIDDWAFAAADRTVEIRSGRDDSLLRTWSLASGTPVAVAAAVDAAGHSFAAFVTFQPPSTAEIAIHDLMTGAGPLILAAKQWNSVACLGDVDGDSALDWVACDLGVLHGRLTAFSGATGATIWTVTGGINRPNFGVRTVSDLSGDGEDDVLVSSSPGSSKVIGRDGVTGAMLFELSEPVPGSGSDFGAAITPLGDLDHDGLGDFAVGAPGGVFGFPRGFVDVYSGKTARLLRRIDGALDGLLGDRFGDRFAELARGATFVLRDQGRWRPALFAASPTAGILDEGCVQLIALSDLFLEIDPSKTFAGFPVIASTRGGKPGAPSGLYLVAINGVPVDQFCEFGVLDSFGEWTTSDIVPPGLASTEFTFRSYAIGADGRLSWSTLEMLTIL